MTSVELVALIIVAVILIWLFRKKPNRLGIAGKHIWTDKGQATKPFFNAKYHVLGKPDLMYRVPGGVLAVEYKSRKGAVYNSDIVQAKVASLAARGAGFKVTRILVKTATKESYIDLPKADEQLYAQVKDYIDDARKAKQGRSLPAKASKRKCQHCAYCVSCKYSLV